MNRPHDKKLNSINEICEDLKQIEKNNAFYIDKLLSLLNKTLVTLVLDLDKKTTLEEIERFCKEYPELVGSEINQKLLSNKREK